MKIALLAALCVLAASDSFAQFWDVQRSLWTGEHDHFCGNTLISTSTLFNNSGSLIYSTSTFPTNTGPLALTDLWMSGDYWWAADVLVQGSDGVAINNTGTIQSIVSGYGSSQAIGILSLQSGLVITNWGTIDGQVRNHDGEADGVWTDSQSSTLINNGTISARSQFVARGINTQQRVNIVNNGTIQAIADAGTEGITANRAKAHCFGIGGDQPTYFENNGRIKCIGTSSTATNEIQLFTCWNNGPVVFKNTGLLYSENSSPNGHSQTAYFGAQSYDLVLYNSGTITNAASDHNGLTMWYENDGDRGNMILNNSGTITSPGSSLLFLTGHWGPPGFLRTYYTNSGTFSGGQMRFYGIPATIYESGQIHATLFGLSDYSDVHIMGLPTVDPTLECGGNNTSPLEFNLIGTLQQVNGSSASGTNLSAFNLGPSGSIVVSGKTYRWSGAASVSGIVNPTGCVPSPWQQQDIGSVGAAGGAVYCDGMFTVLASGNNIGGTADAFHFVYQAADNNCSIIAPVTSPRTTNPNGQAGVMIRNSLNANSANAFIGLTATNTVTFQYRSADGGSTTSNSAIVVSTMHWVKLTRSGSALTGYYSVDGTNWTQLGSTTVSPGAANYMGLAFCSNNNSVNGMATFYCVTCTGGLLTPSVPVELTATAGIEQATLNWQASSNTASYSIGRSTISGGPYTTVGNASGTNYTDRNLAGRTTYYYVVTAVTPGSQSTNSAQVSATPTANVPLPWVAQDIGPVGAVGSESYTNGVFTVSGAGADIDNSQSYNVGVLDTCRFVYATNSGNCSIVARVTSVQAIDPESKGGVMIRNGLNDDAANVVIAMTPGIGVVMSSRSASSANATLVNNVTSLTEPCWVALVRNGNSFSGYCSTNGNNWALVGTTTVSMTATEYLGLTTTSRDNFRLCTATFDNVSALGWPAASGPTGLAVTSTPVGTARLTWNALANATSYSVKRSPASGGPYTTIASAVATTNYTDLGAYSIADCYYVVSALIGGSETANSSEAALHHLKLTGAIIGTPGSWGNSGNTIAKVFDNNLTTFFDAPNGNGAWVGLDFGPTASSSITQINYCPRSGYEGRMVGGVFQGANQADFSDAVTLYTVTAQPPSGTFTSVGLTDTTAFRYVRFLSPDNGFGNVAELQFYGHWAGASLPPPATPEGLDAAAVSGSQINLAWNDATNVTSYHVKRALTDGGPYTVVATGVISNSYHDTGLADSTAYFYVVSGVNPGGESADSVQANATTLPSTPTGLMAAALSATQTGLSWNPVAGATSYKVKRSTLSGGPYLTIAAGVTATDYTDTAPAGIKYYYVVSAVVGGVESLNSAEATVNLPYPWASRDVGSVGIAGGAVFGDGAFTVTGAGGDIQGTADAFQFVYVPTTDDCTIIARVVSVQNTDPWAKAGVMIRQSLAAGAANAFVGLTPGNGATWQYRSSSGGGTTWNNTGSLSAPYWVKLVRSGGTFTGYRSSDGTTWAQQGNTSINMSGIVYVGLALTSHNSSTLGTATFDNVTAPGWQGQPPAAPSGVVATAVSTSQIHLTWNAVTNASGYNLKRSTTDSGPYTVIALGLIETNYTDADLTTDTTYYYVVSALNLAGEGADSAQAAATPQSPPSLSISATGTDLTFSWPLASAGFTLQSRTNLASGEWLNFTSPAPQIVNGQWQVTLTPSGSLGTVFYRLAK